MFVYSMRAGTVRFFGVVLVAVLLLVTLVAFVPELQPVAAAGEAEEVQSIRYEDVESAADGVEFLAQFGWEVDSEPSEEVTLKIPAEFDKVMNTYNELQKKQGLDISKYSKKKVTRYTYEVTNYSDSALAVSVNLLVYRSRIIAADISSTSGEGFVLPLCDVTPKMLIQ